MDLKVLVLNMFIHKFTSFASLLNREIDFLVCVLFDNIEPYIIPSIAKTPINIKKYILVSILGLNTTKVLPPMLPRKNEKNMNPYIKPFDLLELSDTINWEFNPLIVKPKK